MSKLDKLTHESFEAYLNEPFRITASAAAEDDPNSELEDVTLEAELIEVRALGAETGADDDRRRPFSLLYRGPAEPALPQGIRIVEHAEMGEMGIFLVPIGPDEHGMRYEAVFN